MLSNQAFNAFLKTLEEPPAHAIFILATTEKHKIIPTILSRCQIFDFKRISVSDMRDHLKRIAVREGIDADEEALHIIAQKADGALRDSLSIFDRVVSFSGNNLTVQAVTENLNVLDRESYFNMTDLILDNNIPQLLVDYDLIMAKGFEGQHFINGLASHFRDLMVCKDPRTIALLEVGEVNKKKYLEQSQRSELLFLQRAVTMANDTDNQYRNSRNPRLLIEICLMQLASITADGEKKNDLNHILPAVYFINHNIQESKLFERTSKQEVAKEPILAAIKQHSVVAATQASTLEKAMPQQEKDPATSVPKTAPVLQSPDIEHPDSETIAEIEAIEKEIAATKAPQPTLIDVAPLQVADEQEPYELEDDEKIEMAFDFDLDLEEITPLDKIAAPVVKSVTTALVSENGPLIIQEVAAPTSSAKTMIKEAVAINDDLESKKRALQEKLKQRVSKFSLQGIEAANNHQTQNKGPIIHAHELPQDPFTTEQVIDLWNAYKSQLIKDGSNNLASCMNIAIPIIEETTIKLRFPNQSMKEELENSKGQILNYIRQHVNNHLIDLEIAVDLSIQKKYVYTDQDKYVTMVQKNPAVALLQELFDLDF
jgi:DNA polymerase-3 subunit gamma/tau